MTPEQRAADRYARTAADAGVSRDQFENFVRAGVVLQERQLAMSAAARLCDHPDGPTRIGVGGARGGGKSHWGIAQIGADDCQREPNLKCLLLRKVGKANKENFEDLRRRLLMHLPHQYNRQEGILTFRNQSRIIVGHFQKESDIDAYLGLEYDVILVEEATTLTSSKLKDIATCNRTSKPNWRPRIYLTTNPGGVGHASFKREFVTPYRLKRERNTRFVPSLPDQNAFLDPQYIKTNLDTLTGWKYRAWRLGDWDIAAGQFFTNWREDLHVLKAFLAPQGWRFWCSLDYGFTHYTTCYLLAQDGDGNIYVLDEHAERGWLPKRHAPAIRAMLARHGLELEMLWRFVAGADVFATKGHGKTIAQDYADEGIHFTAANDDRVNGAGEILSRLGDADIDPPIAPRLFITDRCPRLIECIPYLEHDPHRPEDVLKVDCDEDGLGGDDPYDGARYGIMAAWGRSGTATSGGERAALSMSQQLLHRALPQTGNPLQRPGSPIGR